MRKRTPQTESELVEFVRSIDARAPESLHRRVDSLIAESPARRRPISLRSFGTRQRLAAGAFAAALVAIAVALSLGGSTSPTLSLRRASALTLSEATAPGPAQNPSNPSQLA